MAPRGTQKRAAVESDSDSGDMDAIAASTQAVEAVEDTARKMVRYALSCEYSRVPVRKNALTELCNTGAGGGRRGAAFKAVFPRAQRMLEEVWGMRLEELPLREKVTMAQRRAAQRAEKATMSSNTWVLVSVLPAEMRGEAIVPPPKVPNAEEEAAYVGLYSFIVAVITLSGGSLGEAKLDRHLRRVNAESHTPVGSTDEVLKRMVREGYVVKIKDSSGGEEVVEYIVGGRGKVEVGEEGVAGLVRAVYGGDVDVEKKLERSLGLLRRDRGVVHRSAMTRADEGDEMDVDE
ncbi:MAGE-domain-containing protein [Trichodelitschia bisporula]|uniref:MAGE-domain-containing protein n=1 Tax=Trichodelitschia bisporula TaxID=703511 RepID=A0A6G1HI10_9PEZI|nr:MAGE-domain-containing protein [Trichodelitschia bisporula]